MLKDLWQFMKARKKWWIAPILLMLLAVGAFVFLSTSTAIAPFIYTLF